MNYCINDLTEVMHAHNAKYLTHGSSETLQKLYCLNLTKQQEREYKEQQKTFHIPFYISLSQRQRKLL